MTDKMNAVQLFLLNAFEIVLYMWLYNVRLNFVGMEFKADRGPPIADHRPMGTPLGT